MGSSKTFQYTHATNKLAVTAKALSHSARVTIVTRLVEHGMVTNEDVIELTQLSGATVSQHLRQLFIAGIIREIWVLDKHYYALTSEAGDLIACLSKLGGKNGL